MSSELIGSTLPAHDPSFPEPRGLRPVLQEIEEAVAYRKRFFVRGVSLSSSLKCNRPRPGLRQGFTPLAAGGTHLKTPKTRKFESGTSPMHRSGLLGQPSRDVLDRIAVESPVEFSCDKTDMRCGQDVIQ
jgi:hypothetical protein